MYKFEYIGYTFVFKNYTIFTKIYIFAYKFCNINLVYKNYIMFIQYTKFLILYTKMYTFAYTIFEYKNDVYLYTNLCNNV